MRCLEMLKYQVLGPPFQEKLRTIERYLNGKCILKLVLNFLVVFCDSCLNVLLIQDIFMLNSLSLRERDGILPESVYLVLQHQGCDIKAVAYVEFI